MDTVPQSPTRYFSLLPIGQLFAQDAKMDTTMTPEPALANAPLSDPKSNSEACSAFYTGKNAPQAAVSWKSEAKHAH